MLSKSKRIKDFQVKLLAFLYETNAEEVHIYHHVMNAWSNDMSMLSLPDMKEAITDLCNRKMIVSKNNAHLSIGLPGSSEEDQKNNAICILQDAGRSYYKKARLMGILRGLLKLAILILVILVAIYTLYYFRKVIFKFLFKAK